MCFARIAPQYPPTPRIPEVTKSKTGWYDAEILSHVKSQTTKRNLIALRQFTGNKS